MRVPARIVKALALLPENFVGTVPLLSNYI
jgi:hypothetical protein